MFLCRGLNRSATYLKNLVGARGFEPRASCAQASRAISWKSFLFNLCIEHKRVRKIFGSGTMCGNVPPHAWSPPNFPHSEITAICVCGHDGRETLALALQNRRTGQLRIPQPVPYQRESP